MRYAHPGTDGAIVSFKSRYGNYINGEFVPPVKGEYFTNTSPVNGKPIAVTGTAIGCGGVVIGSGSGQAG